MFLDAQRRKSPAEKVAEIFDRSAMMRRMSEAVVRRRYPQADEREIFLRRVRREFGADLFRRVYGDVLPEHPAEDGNA